VAVGWGAPAWLTVAFPRSWVSKSLPPMPCGHRPQQYQQTRQLRANSPARTEQRISARSVADSLPAEPAQLSDTIRRLHAQARGAARELPEFRRAIRLDLLGPHRGRTDT
jgi:hypothetical protein